MSAARIAMLITAVGFVALVVGLTLSPMPWLAAVVGGALLIGAGLLIDDRPRGPRSPSGRAGQ